MKPNNTSHRGLLQYPLDSVLGSRAQVRLLRVLMAQVDGPISVADAARLAELTHAGAKRALSRLADAGFVEIVGAGNRGAYGIRPDAVSSSWISRAFEEEQDRYDRFIHALKAAVAIPETLTVWLAPLPTAPNQPIHLTTVVETRALPWIGEEFRNRLIRIEHDLDVIVEVSVYTQADEYEPAPGVTLLWGTPLDRQADSRRAVQAHSELTERSRALAQGVAKMIREDPTLIRRAIRYVKWLLEEGQGLADSDVAEWLQLLETYSPERLSDLMTSTTSRAERLRQSSPFFAVLTSAERDGVLSEAYDSQ